MRSKSILAIEQRAPSLTLVESFEAFNSLLGSNLTDQIGSAIPYKPLDYPLDFKTGRLKLVGCGISFVVDMDSAHRVFGVAISRPTHLPKVAFAQPFYNIAKRNDRNFGLVREVLIKAYEVLWQSLLKKCLPTENTNFNKSAKRLVKLHEWEPYYAKGKSVPNTTAYRQINGQRLYR